MGEDIFEVFADDRGLDDDLAVVVQRRHLAARIDGLEPVFVVFELRRVEETTGELEALLIESEHGLQGVGAGAEAIEREHLGLQRKGKRGSDVSRSANPCLNPAGMGGASAATLLRHFIVGITKSALTDFGSGQRSVTVFRRV